MLSLRDPNIPYFSLYSFTYLFYGCVVSVLGPIIPYLAIKYDVDQTSFNYLFVCRGAGFLVGGLLTHYATKVMNYHNLSFVSIALCGVCFVVFAFGGKMWVQGACVLAASAFCALFEVVINLSVVRAFRGGKEDFWLQILHGVFGIGALIAPAFVWLFGMYGVLVVGIGLIVSIPGYVILPSPEQKIFPDQNVTKQTAGNITYLSKKSAYVLGFMMLLFFGQETSQAGWIATYAVNLGFANQKQATIFPSLFWLMVTSGRFFLASIDVPPTKKLYRLFSAQIVTCLFCSFLQIFSLYELSAYISSLTLGVCFSSMYALLYTASIQYRQHLQTDQAIILMVFASFGEFIPGSLGLLMAFFGVKSLFLIIGFIGLMEVILLSVMIKQMKIKLEDIQNQPQQLKQLLNP